jgi:GT2 family glycosyltransferase
LESRGHVDLGLLVTLHGANPRAPVSVVVPTIGRVELLRECVASIARCDPLPGEVVVVDQSGDPGFAGALDPPAALAVEVVASDVRSIGAALNAGLEHARHDVVAVTHDDCRVAADWVGVAARLAARHPGALLTGRVLAAEGAGHVPSVKEDPEPRDYTGELHDNVLYPANMVLDRATVLAAGGFDPRLAVAAEDNDLCYRWLRAGRPLRYEPALVVWHADWRGPAELAAMYEAYARGAGVFYAKHLRARDLRVLRFVARDAKDAARGAASALLRRRSGPVDARRGLWRGLPAGLRAGWRLYARDP